MRERRSLVIPATAAFMLMAAPAFAATMATGQTSPAKSAAAEAPQQISSAEIQAFSKVKVPLAQAIMSVQKESNGKVLGATFEPNTGKPMYDVLVFANNAEEHYKVDANSGAVMKASQPATAMSKLDKEDSAEVNAVKSAKLDLAQAITTAEHRGGGKAIDASIEDHNGATSYEIQTVKNGNLQAFTVNPQSGAVVSG
jgi:uncharacterized membrane protein YkoI